MPADVQPCQILEPYVRVGMTVLEPGPGMGFFTLELARLVGPSGRVVAADIQPKMLDGLKRRAQKAGVVGRLDVRLAQPDALGLDDLRDKVDFVLAFAMVHEMPSASRFFQEASRAMMAGANLLLAEPAGHVKPELVAAAQAGLIVTDRPAIRRSLSALLTKA
jgi:ubiquinone/menaquinone biosynthesis C-methylase UbiE